MALDLPYPSSHHAAIRLMGSRMTKLVVFTTVATFLVVWAYGWFTASPRQEAVDLRRSKYQKSIQHVENVLDSYMGSSPKWWPSQKRLRPGTGAVTPFSTFSCLGDEHAADIIYARPFRFHIYMDLPEDLCNETQQKALSYWRPDHSNNQFETESRLEDLTLHPCHTLDPYEADAFLVPVQKEAGVNDGGRATFEKVTGWLESKSFYTRYRGRDHYAMGIAWDKTRRPFGEINLFGPEVPTDFKDIASFDLPRYVHGLRDIVIPYPDPDPVEYYTEERLATVPRSKLAIFVGSMVKQSPIRERLAKQMLDYNKRKGAALAVWKYVDHNTDTHAIKKLLPTAIFGPVMEGDSFSSRRLFSLIFAGTIPVIVCDHLMLPYEDLLDYSSFVVFVSEQDVLQVEDFNLFDLLGSIPKLDIKRLQENGKKVKKHFIFHRGDVVPGDAFDMFVRSLALVTFNERRLRNMIRRVSDSAAPASDKVGGIA